MKGFFRSKGFKLLATASVILCAAMIYTAALGGGGISSATSSLVGIFTTPMQWLASLGGEKLDGLTTNTQELNALRSRLDAMQQELDEKNNQLANYNELKRQNEDLKNYIGLHDDNSDWKFVYATVVGRDANELFSGFTINRGSVAGVRAGDPVITNSGLVGRVAKVGTTYAKVETIYHPDVKVSVLSANTEEIGVLTGDKQYADQGLVQMGSLNAKTQIKAGDLIVTSGMGGVFPDKIIVGTVESIVNGTVDVSLTALVRPTVDVSSITSVMVITSFTGQGETMEALDEKK